MGEGVAALAGLLEPQLQPRGEDLQDHQEGLTRGRAGRGQLVLTPEPFGGVQGQWTPRRDREEVAAWM